ncbi:MAG: hypothetical protein IJH38_00060 [Clostridia bacterium]|nr:hypothetical protein [Clostridia bacterium]
MRLKCVKLDPTGNITVLVTDPVPRERQREVALRLLDPERMGGEQAGFVEAPLEGRCDARLQMMGGEFCGNATMSLGALIARDRGLADGASLDLDLEVSGADGPVACRITRSGEGFIGRVAMPLPLQIGQMRLDADGTALSARLVRFPGIAHLIVPASRCPEEAILRKCMPAWCGIIGADALGVLAWDEGARSIDPIVYVPSAGTLIREHGCGSGTAAIGCAIAGTEGKSIDLPVRQSGGIITVSAQVRGKAISALSITGKVTVVREDTVEV